MSKQREGVKQDTNYQRDIGKYRPNHWACQTCHEWDDVNGCWQGYDDWCQVTSITKTNRPLKAKHGSIIMRESTERALRWFLKDKVEEQINIIESRSSYWNHTIGPEEEARHCGLKELLRGLEEALDKS